MQLRKRHRRCAPKFNSKHSPLRPGAQSGSFRQFFLRWVEADRLAYEAMQPFRVTPIADSGKHLHYRGANIEHLACPRWTPGDYLVFGYHLPLNLLEEEGLRDDAQRWAERMLAYDWCIGQHDAPRWLSLMFVSPIDCDLFWEEWHGPYDERW